MPLDSTMLFAHIGDQYQFVPQIVAPKQAPDEAVWLLYQGDYLVGREAAGGGILPLVAGLPRAVGIEPCARSILAPGRLATRSCIAFQVKLASVLYCPRCDRTRFAQLVWLVE